MNIEKIAEAIGKMNDKYLEEVFEYKKKDRISIKKIAAIAACAALVIGGGMAAIVKSASPSSEPITFITDYNFNTFEANVEPSYSFNEQYAESIENDEIETYFELPIECGDYRYVMKKVEYSAAIPEYIAKEDIIWRLGGDEYVIHALMKKYGTYPHEPGDGTLMIENLDESGIYTGDVKHTWVFVTLEMTNLSDEAANHNIYWHYINYERPKDGHYMWFRKVTIVPGEEFSEEITADDYFHTDPVEIHFEPNETKTVIFGYLIESDFIHESLKICLEPEDQDMFKLFSDDIKLPLK